jgi:hypothetical protein
LRHGEAERLNGLEVDRYIEFRAAEDEQIAPVQSFTSVVNQQNERATRRAAESRSLENPGR